MNKTEMHNNYEEGDIAMDFIHGRSRSSSIVSNMSSDGSIYEFEGETTENATDDDGEYIDTENVRMRSSSPRKTNQTAPQQPQSRIAKRKRSGSGKRTKTGAWTEEEDNRLRELVQQHGAQRWSTIAQSLPGRIGKQARERWFNHLSPDINKSWWTEDEERFIVEFHDLYGNLWSQLSRMLDNGRPANMIKNHWNSTLKRAVERGKASANPGDTHYFVELPACPTKRETGRGSTKAAGTGQYIRIKFRKAGDPIDDRLKIPEDEETAKNSSISPRSNMSISPRSSPRTRVARRRLSLDQDIKIEEDVMMEEDETMVEEEPGSAGVLEPSMFAMPSPSSSSHVVANGSTMKQINLGNSSISISSSAEPGTSIPFPYVPPLPLHHQHQQAPFQQHAGLNLQPQHHQHQNPQTELLQQQQHHQQMTIQQKYAEQVERARLQRQRQAALERMAYNDNESLSCWKFIANIQDQQQQQQQISANWQTHQALQLQQMRQQQQQQEQNLLFMDDTSQMDPLFDVEHATSNLNFF